jgi:uncharacterized protein YeaO (DUF488 family)
LIHIKRVYEKPEKSDGAQFLVDRLWPRGVKKENLQVEGWLKEIAPSNDLRRWFGHDPERWEAFKERYFGELRDKSEELHPLRDAMKKGDVTLLYSARDKEHNNAAALKVYLKEK